MSHVGFAFLASLRYAVAIQAHLRARCLESKNLATLQDFELHSGLERFLESANLATLRNWELHSAKGPWFFHGHRFTTACVDDLFGGEYIRGPWFFRGLRFTKSLYIQVAHVRNHKTLVFTGCRNRKIYWCMVHSSDAEITQHVGKLKMCWRLKASSSSSTQLSVSQRLNTWVYYADREPPQAPKPHPFAPKRRASGPYIYVI